tara:strand:+ start:623 stop:1438 length:816 start_codon:yes stop_codon:yes gene_type:complete
MINTIILTVHNKEKTIFRILTNLVNNLSKKTIKVIIVLDGCNDNTSIQINKFLKNNKRNIDFQLIFTEDIWETKANNVGLRSVKTKYATIVQDDMLIMQKNWDSTLLNYLSKFKLFSISGRAAHDFSFINSNQFIVKNISGREYPISNNNFLGRVIGKLVSIFKPYWIYKYFRFFAIRLVANRGPLVIDMKIAKKLNFFDESFAPFELDDVDLCCRAFKKFGLRSATNPIFYIELNGSKKNNFSSKLESEKSILKNTKILIKRHQDLSNLK